MVVPFSITKIQKYILQGFSGGSVVNNLSANAGDIGLIPGPRRSHGLQSD